MLNLISYILCNTAYYSKYIVGVQYTYTVIWVIICHGLKLWEMKSPNKIKHKRLYIQVAYMTALKNKATYHFISTALPHRGKNIFIFLRPSINLSICFTKSLQQKTSEMFKWSIWLKTMIGKSKFCFILSYEHCRKIP